MRGHAQVWPKPSPHSPKNQSIFPLRVSRRAPSRGPTWSPPSERNCMSKCQRHSVQLLTARTVNDRRRRLLSPCRRVVAEQSRILPCAALDKRMRLVSGGYYSLSLSFSLSLSLSLSLFLFLCVLTIHAFVPLDLLSSVFVVQTASQADRFSATSPRRRMFAAVLYFAQKVIFKEVPRVS